MATQKPENLPPTLQPLAVNSNSGSERKSEEWAGHLTEQELMQLASKIYELLRQELRLERDRWQ